MSNSLASPSAQLPANQSLAVVEIVRGYRHVRLPARFAVAAARRFIEIHRAVGDVVEGPAELGPGLSITLDQWALRAGMGMSIPMRFDGSGRRVGNDWVWIFPRHTIVLRSAADVGYLLRSLEDVKPEELDATGRPLPWVPEHQRVEALIDRVSDDDATVIGQGERLPPPAPDAPDVPGAVITTAEIHLRFAEIVSRLGIFAPELTVTRGLTPRHGLVTGRVWYSADFAPLRVHITTCPSSDWAEVLATLVHELAHPLSRAKTHDFAFKSTAIAIAERLYGERCFVGARARVDQPYGVVDMWLASGIRAALRGGEPPVLKEGARDDVHLARILSKIRKLRELSANQLGLPEGIAATATANDLITMYGLESYAVQIDGGIDEQMIDRFVVLEDCGVWRRMLAHAVADYCEVFALSTGKQRMHFFGTRCDVLAAEYIYAVSAARIERECRDHLERWRRQRVKTTSAETLREKTSFCDCAVIEFRKKLVLFEMEEARFARAPTRGGPLHGREAAEAFARVEYVKRGSSWGATSGKQHRENAAGRAAGAAMEVVRGVDGPGQGEPARLTRW